MTKTAVIILCIFCLIMSGIIAVGGYTSYKEYRANKTTLEIGQEILGETDNTISVITDTVTWVKNKLNFNIGDYFYKLWIRIKKAFIEAFDWIPGVDYDDDNNTENDFGTSGEGFGVPETNGTGGGGGGARG